MLSEEEAKDRLEDADEDNDGMITWNEYLSDAYGMDGSKEGFDLSEENEHVREYPTETESISKISITADI